MIYCILLQSTVPSRRECKDVETLLTSFLELSYGQAHKRLRAACMMNLLIHLQYEMGYLPQTSFIEKLDQMARRFKDKKELQLRIMYPILKEQIARFNIMSRNKSTRKFVYYNIIAASNFIAEKSIDMENNGIACYLIASKYYESQNLHSWNLILEFPFYNLGGLYLGQKNYSNALYYCIQTLNNSKMFDGQTSEKSKKSFKKMTNIIAQAMKSQGSIDMPNVSNFIRQYLKIMKFGDFNIQTEDEQFYNLTVQREKKEQAKTQKLQNEELKTESRLIGNSLVSKKNF
jgi:hypothetical protein